MELTLGGVTYVGAVFLAGVFLVAGGAKLAWRTETVHNFAQLGLPQPRLLATALPLVEIALAVLLVVVPPVGGIGALITLAAFNLLLYGLVQRGTEAPCGCIGTPRRAKQPVSARELVRNGCLAFLAAGALFAEPGMPSGLDLVVAVTVIAAGWTGVSLVGRRRPVASVAG